jgi:hypothetical protein
MPKSTNVLFAELSADALTAGRLFDGLAAGSFIDMHGRSVTFKPEELSIYLSNTLAAIAATTAESGEVVGLPIDAHDHENGDGSGWIVGAELEGSRIRLQPKWTDIGVDLVKRGIRRFFSATVDTVNKVILGGTLTNWPATRDPQGKVMLRPIELAQMPGTYELADAAEDSLNDKLQDVYDAWRAQQAPPEPSPYCFVVDAYEDHVIVSENDELYSVAYTRGEDDKVVFVPRSEWVAVKQTYVEAAMKQFRRLARLFGFDKANPEHKPGDKSAADKPVPPTGDNEMAIKLAELSAEDRAELVKLVAAQMAPAPAAPPAANPGATSAIDMSQLLGVQPLTEDGKKKLTELMQQQAAHVQEQAALAFQAQMGQIQRETALTDLSMRITGGTPDAPRGVKGTTAEDLKRHLSALPVNEAKYFGDLLSTIVKDGLVEFSEMGHAHRLTGTHQLPPEIAASLDKGEIKLADLSSSILGLGDLTQYDLSKWQGSK